MWTIIVLILNATANKDAVTCRVRFTANGGPYDGASKVQEFVYTHPTSVDEIIDELSTFASMLKVSFDAPANLKGMTWEV